MQQLKQVSVHIFPSTSEPDCIAGPAQSSTLKENAKIAWHGFKFATKTAEAVVDGTPFKIPIAVVKKVFDLADVSDICYTGLFTYNGSQSIIDNKESVATLLLPLGQRLNVVSEALTQKHLARDIQPTLQRFSRCVITVAVAWGTEQRIVLSRRLQISYRICMTKACSNGFFSATNIQRN